MATVESWFWPFVARHTARVPRSDWPEPDSEFWEMHRAAFARRGVSEAVADDASRMVAEGGSVFLDAHLATFLKSVERAWKESEVGPGGPGGGIDAARHESRDCLDCSGMGLASRFRHESAAPGRPGAVVFYCLCSMGRFLKGQHASAKSESARDIPRRIPDLADFPSLQLGPVSWASYPDNRHRHRRSEWDAALGRPASAPASPVAIRPAAIGRPSAAADRRRAVRSEFYPPIRGVPDVAEGPDGKLYTLDHGRPPWTVPAPASDAPAF